MLFFILVYSLSLFLNVGSQGKQIIMSNLLSLEFMGRVCETQLQVGENFIF